MHAQSADYWNVNPDSLRRVLASQRSDTARTRTLRHILYIDQDFTYGGIHELQQLLPLLQRQPVQQAYRLWLAGIQLPQPLAKQPRLIRDQALDSLQAAVRVFDRLGLPSPPDLFDAIGALYSIEQFPPRAQIYWTQQLSRYLRQPARWWHNARECLSNLAPDYATHGDYQQAINCFLQIIDLTKTYYAHESETFYSGYYGNVGSAYADWGNYAKAQYYFQRALQAYAPAGKLDQQPTGLLLYLECLLARAYLQQHHFSEAQQVLNQGLRQSEYLPAANRDYFITILLLLQSNLWLDQQRPSKAGPLLAQAQAKAARKGLDTLGDLTLFPLAATWARYYAQRGQPAKASVAWQRAYQQARTAHSPRQVLDYAQQMAQFYQTQQQPGRAAPYALLALHLADSLAAQQGEALVARYEVVQADRAQAVRLAYTQQQQRQAAAQAQRQRRALLYTAAGVVVLLLLAGVLYAAFRRSRRLTHLVTTQRDQLDTSLTELRQTQTQLIQKEKMASLGELTAGIAHEIQNPLNFVNNFADVSQELVQELEEAQAAGDGPEVLALAVDVRQNLGKISEHGRRAAGIVRGMLEHSRQSTGERQPTNINQIADEYLRLAYHGLRAKDPSFNAELQTDLASNLPLVEAVPGDLGRVLLNLFTNAFYAVQQRQQAGEAGYVPTVSVHTQQVGQQVLIQVQDNGTGMSPEVQAKIFQPFFTTKPTGEGTGLGLSLSYDIITKGHGGTLTVESQLGQGSTFTVSLPTS